FGESDVRTDSDIKNLLCNQTGEGLPETIKFLVEVQVAPQGCHGSRHISAFFTRTQPDPHTAIADIEHGKHPDHQKQAAQINRCFPRTAGDLEHTGLNMIEV